MENQIEKQALDEQEKEIDLIELGYVLFDKLHYIIFALLLGALVLNIYSYTLIKPTYQSTSKLYVVSASEDSVINLTDLNIGSSLTKDYEELMLSYPVLNKVINELDLDMKYENLKNLITLENPENTRVLKITVTSTDPEVLMNIANTLAEVAVEYLPDTMNTLSPNIAQRALLPEQQVGPNYLKYTMMGAILGIIIMCAFFVIRYIMDDTVHNAEEFEKVFGIVPLAVVPEGEGIQGNDLNEKTISYKRRRKGRVLKWKN